MVIEMQEILNVRDLGGYVMKDGRVVKERRLIRGASIHKASASDLSLLSRGYDVRLDFDFRTENEVNRAPDKEIEGAEYLWLPTLDPELGVKGLDVFTSGGFTSTDELVRKGCFLPMVQKASREMYTSIIDNEYSQLQYAIFLQKIVSLKDGAVYWHCSQGKDRTGLGAAFVLAALGASRECVIQDYLLSSDAYVEDVAEYSSFVLSIGGGPDELDVVQTFIGVNIDHFIEGLELIDSKYGGMDSYLKNVLLLSDEDKQRLRENYLESH